MDVEKRWAWPRNRSVALHASSLLPLGLQEWQQIAKSSPTMAAQAPQTMLNAGGLRSYSKGLEHLHAHAGITHLTGSVQTGNQAQPQLFKADVSLLLKGDELLQEEVFGPTTIVIEVADDHELKLALQSLRGQLTATLIGEPLTSSSTNGLSRCWSKKLAVYWSTGIPPAQNRLAL
jgi:alpha-ketoglutaric semialdehyde dehydrogenase